MEMGGGADAAVIRLGRARAYCVVDEVRGRRLFTDDGAGGTEPAAGGVSLTLRGMPVGWRMLPPVALSRLRGR